MSKYVSGAVIALVAATAVTSVAAVSVPLGAWGMIAAGFGAVSLGARRRRSARVVNA